MAKKSKRPDHGICKAVIHSIGDCRRGKMYCNVLIFELQYSNKNLLVFEFYCLLKLELKNHK